jgi:hypothetical protein
MEIVLALKGWCRIADFHGLLRLSTLAHRGWLRVDLPQGLIKNNTRSHGQIQAADMGVTHRDCQTAVTIQSENVFGQAFCLLAEDQFVTGTELDIRVRSCCFCGKKVKSLLIRLLQEGLKVGPMVDLDKGPVIQPGPLEMLVVNLETERMDQVEHGIGCPAQSGNGPGVGRYLRFNKNDMKGGIGHGLSFKDKVKMFPYVQNMD